MIAQAIERWIVVFVNSKDSQGRALFTSKTEKIAKEQTKKVEWVQDPANKMEMYRKIPAGKRSTHQLPKWQSNRPESGLEKFHEFLAHLANTGSGNELADSLTVGGTADHNVKARWREKVNEQKLLGNEINGTVEYADEPEFFDHAYLHHLNNVAISPGLDPVFDYVVLPSGENNGEVFVSAYYEEQQKRNAAVGQDSETKLCNCRHCPSQPLQNRRDFKRKNNSKETMRLRGKKNNNKSSVIGRQQSSSLVQSI